MKQRKVKWTQAMRGILYARLVMEFGSYDEWGATFCPKDRGERYREVLRELACFFYRITSEQFTWKAVKQQVDWACTKQEEVKNGGHARQFFLNKAAAIEMGFLKGSQLPAYLLCESAV